METRTVAGYAHYALEYTRFARLPRALNFPQDAISVTFPKFYTERH